jgi:lipid-A-disaccharide synthase
MTRTLYLIAGEESGDILGARLMAAITARDPGIRYAGIGGARMQAAGLERSLFPMRELSLMGLAEVLPSILRLKRRLDETLADIAARQPAALVTIDAPGFTLRVAARVHGSLPVIHYVAPQVWAWRKGRARKLARIVDRLLCLLPFEPEVFRAVGLDARFVGHPVMESGMDRGDGQKFRAAHGIAPDAPLVAVLPGSRHAEVSRLLPAIFETLRRVDRPGLRVVVPTVAAVDAEVRGAEWPVAPIFVDAATRAGALAASTAALCKSGTATLEVALAGCPMLVLYRLNPLTSLIARNIITVRFASLVNLLADREIAPEFLQEYCNPGLMAPELARLLEDPAAREAQRAGFREALGRLAAPGGVAPSEAAAAAVLEVIAAKAPLPCHRSASRLDP